MILLLFKARRVFKGRPSYRLERHRWRLAVAKEGELPVGIGRETEAALPSSAGLSTLEAGRAYWQEHFGGKTISLTVHSGGKDYPIRVFFGATNDHAYTDSRDEKGRKLKGRVFSEERASAMSRILQVISRPRRRLRSGNSVLLLEGRVGGKHYTVALEWSNIEKKYAFQSAHFKSLQDVDWLQRSQPPKKDKGPL